MNDHEIDRISASMNMLRPDWPKQQLRTLLKDERITDRPRRDVCVALSWIACEPNSHTPYRVLEAGPWWRAAGTDATTSKREKVEPNERCSICSESLDKCRRVWSDDHEFEASTVAAKRKAEGDPDGLSKAIAALKAEVAETPQREPSHGRTLEDLADRDPKLRARVDALRDALPKEPPMREPEPDEPIPVAEPIEDEETA